MIWLDTVAQGIRLGGLYALFAAGLGLAFGIIRLMNLAHGDLIVLAAFAILVAVTALRLHPALAALAMFGVGWALQLPVPNHVLVGDVLPPLLVTFHPSAVIQNALLGGFSTGSRRLPAGAPAGASLTSGRSRQASFSC